MTHFRVFIVLFFISAALQLVAQETNAWSTDFEMAKTKAVAENKLILLNFSGSDWCGPCIKFKKDVLASTILLNYAGEKLVLLNADFPRQKKNAPDPKLQKQNDNLAEKYNHEGIFPYTVLLDKSGKVLKAWAGNPGLTPEQFIDQISFIQNAGH